MFRRRVVSWDYRCDRTVQGRFLTHALELRGDDRGDAQGCVFQDGAVSKVELHWHTQNGVP